MAEISAEQAEDLMIFAKKAFAVGISRRWPSRLCPIDMIEIDIKTFSSMRRSVQLLMTFSKVPALRELRGSCGSMKIVDKRPGYYNCLCGNVEHDGFNIVGDVNVRFSHEGPLIHPSLLTFVRFTANTVMGKDRPEPMDHSYHLDNIEADYRILLDRINARKAIA